MFILLQMRCLLQQKKNNKNTKACLSSESKDKNAQLLWALSSKWFGGFGNTFWQPTSPNLI